jgi:N-acetylglucosaminyldiphosphoundecaprenol N-acetyl-beta-D-mannosaminyltransferase
VIDETDALVEQRGDAPDKPVVVEPTLGRPVLVEATLVGPVIVEPTILGPVIAEPTNAKAVPVDGALDLPVTVPAMRDGVAADALAVPRPESGTPPEATAPPQLRVGPFQICDLSRDDVVAAIVSGAIASRAQRAWVSYALHVGGLNSRRDTGYLAAMSRADLVYADGMSVIVLAKLAGARAAERAGTTDIGWSVIRELGLALGRPARIALIGGPEGLTRRAARVIEADAGAEVVLTEHGYHDDWSPVLDRVTNSGCDMILVGLGAPREMTWVDEHVQDLPPSLVMTCGGWFGFITQDEKRAPQWVCDAGLEWTYRIAQSPRRLAKRYARGAISTAALSVQIIRSRTRSA